jgi:hypothetical protein
VQTVSIIRTTFGSDGHGPATRPFIVATCSTLGGPYIKKKKTDRIFPDPPQGLLQLLQLVLEVVPVDLDPSSRPSPDFGRGRSLRPRGRGRFIPGPVFLPPAVRSAPFSVGVCSRWRSAFTLLKFRRLLLLLGKHGT